MSNENKEATTQTTQTTQEKSIHDPDISFADFERLRKAEKESASAEHTEQKDETKEDSEASKEKLEQDASSDQDDAKNQSDKEDELEDLDEDSQEDDAKPKKKNGVQKRIGRLAKKLSEKDMLLSEKDKRIALLEEQLNGNKAKPKAEAQADDPNSEADPNEPSPEDYQTNAEYIRALRKYDREAEKKEAAAAKAEESKKSEESKRTKAHIDRVSEFKKTQTDYDKVAKEFMQEMNANPDLVPSPVLEDLIFTSDVSAAVMYELMKDTDELIRINGLNFRDATKAFAKLESKVEEKISQQSSSSTTEKKTTKAHAPIAPIGNKSAATVKKSIYDKDIPFAEYEKLRTEELKRKRG